MQRFGRWSKPNWVDNDVICSFLGSYPLSVQLNQSWLLNWGTLISSTITPVQNDAEVREMFQAKLAIWGGWCRVGPVHGDDQQFRASSLGLPKECIALLP